VAFTEEAIISHREYTLTTLFGHLHPYKPTKSTQERTLCVKNQHVLVITHLLDFDARLHCIS